MWDFELKVQDPAFRIYGLGFGTRDLDVHCGHLICMRDDSGHWRRT